MSFFEFPHTRSYDSDLGWLIKKMREILETVSEQNDKIAAVETLAEELRDFVNNYFDNLDVQAEINSKIDTMAQDGTLLELIETPITDTTSEWLAAHITPTSPAVDDTLSIYGAAADAKITGDYIRDLIDDFDTYVYTETVSKNLLDLSTVRSNYYINNTNGEETAYTNWGATDYIPVIGGRSYVFIACYAIGSAYEYIRTDYYAFYNANKEYISGGFNSRGPITAPVGARYIRESTNLPAFSASGMYKAMFGLTTDLGGYVGRKTGDDYIPYGNTYGASPFIIEAVYDTVGHTIKVEQDGSGDYTTLKEAVEYSAEHPDTTILVGAGTYNLVTEFGSDYFDNMTTDAALGTRQGLQIGNGVHIIFSSGAKVTANYTGSNDAVKTCFSPFNFIQGSKGFTLENMNLEAANVRYCVHDEGGNTRSVFYKNVYKNCRMSINNSQNANWPKHQCIGGGLGLHAEIIIEDCVFVDLYNINYRVGAVTYHNALDSAAKSRIVVKGCWFSQNATVRVSWYGTSTEMTQALIHDNSCTVAPYANAESESSTTENVQMLAWNNAIRSA